MENRRLEIKLSIVSLLRILAVLAWASGLIYITFSAIDYASHASVTAEEIMSSIFFGLMMTIPAGGVLLGLSWVVSLISEIKQGQTASDKSRPAE